MKRLMGNRRLFERLLRDFVDDYTDVCSQIVQAVDRGDLSSAGSLLHGMKGAAGNLVAGDVYDISVNIEEAVRRKDRPGIVDLLIKLRPAVDTIVESAKCLLPEGENLTESAQIADRATLGLAELWGPISELNQLLKSNNLAAVNQFERLADMLAGGDMNKQLQQLRLCLNRFEYREAQRSLESIAHRLGVLLT